MWSWMYIGVTVVAAAIILRVVRVVAVVMVVVVVVVKLCRSLLLAMAGRLRLQKVVVKASLGANAVALMAVVLL